MFINIIKKLLNHKDLTIEESKNVIEIIATEEISDVQIAAFLTLLKYKGETIEEISGLAQGLREKAEKINISKDKIIVDSCGTGGDQANTFNISTAASIIAAAAGICVAKHSNFSLTSKCGSSNVLQALGINLSKTSKEVENDFNNKNIAFIHAPYFHKATSRVHPVRKNLGFRTIFNFLGPLTNPTFPTGQVLGVSDLDMCSKMIEVLKILGCKKALVVNSQNPIIDEISICGKTDIYKLENNKIERFEIHPEDFDIKTATLESISGGTPDENAEIIKNIFSGRLKGPKLDILVLNAAALLWVGEKVLSIQEGVLMVYNLIENRVVYNKLQELI